ncbi:MAG: divalent metal cation transporter [Proteobacteria bacterium]|nr:divalent metal cation transporter [Pseudomonadota bacterium]
MPPEAHVPKVKPSRIAATRKPPLWQTLGPGLVTGAADDDPSGIATYSQAGAQFGFRLGWTLLLTFPLMVVIQAISAWLGRTTGHGIAGNLRQHYPRWLLHGIVTLLFIANTLNIGADLGAMAEASRLLLPAAPAWLYVLAFGTVCVAGQVFLPHSRYVAALKWLTVSLFAYFAAACVVHVPWRDFVQGLLLPRLQFSRDFWLMVVAILGTTISPYLFFWQAAQEVEDTKAKPVEQPLLQAPAQGPRAMTRIRVDTMVGMGISNVVALAIMVTTAATLNRRGVSTIESAAQAAEALRPIAGPAAFALFALGILGTGLLSVPVLAGSAAYAVGESLQWPVGLARRPLQAKAFYVTIALATLLGALANVLHVNPVQALVWVAVLNGIVAVPVMALLMLMSVRADVMGPFRISRGWTIIGWVATAVMAAASAFFIAASA